MLRNIAFLIILVVLVTILYRSSSISSKKNDAHTAEQSSPPDEQPHVRQSKKEYSYVEKLNARIEEQAFLLNRYDERSSNDPSQLDRIENELNEISTLAQKKGIKRLIDWSMIQEIKRRLHIYRAAAHGVRPPQPDT